jgi:hypothetical protein
MSESDDLLAAIDRETARQDQITKLLGALVLAMIALLSAKVVDLI